MAFSLKKLQELGDPNEPEIRKVLRQRRIQEKHKRMQQQVGPWWGGWQQHDIYCWKWICHVCWP